jgi:carbamoyl-phosphate synthase large subunit
VIPPSILITGCGAKNRLVSAFRDAVGSDFRLLAADSDATAPALSEAHQAHTLPAWSSSDWSESLLRLCQEQAVKLIVSTSDRELALLKDLTNRLTEYGVQTLIPKRADALEICRNKRLFTEWCIQNGFPVEPLISIPESWPTNYPVFVRPLVAQGGIGAMEVASEDLLKAMVQITPDLVVQPAIRDPEFSVDLLSTFEGKPLQAVVRQRLKVRGGESHTSQVVNIPDLTQVSMKLAESLGLVGHSVVQAFWSPRCGVRLIEVNPRFGGASTLSIQAGLDSPRRLIGFLRGDATALENSPITTGLLMHRISQDFFVYPEPES